MAKIPVLLWKFFTNRRFATNSPGIANATAWGTQAFSSGESHRPLSATLVESIAVHRPSLSQYFCKSMLSSWLEVAYTPLCLGYTSICITMLLAKNRGQISLGTPNEWHAQKYSEGPRSFSLFCCCVLKHAVCPWNLLLQPESTLFHRRKGKNPSETGGCWGGWPEKKRGGTAPL